MLEELILRTYDDTVLIVRLRLVSGSKDTACDHGVGGLVMMVGRWVEDRNVIVIYFTRAGELRAYILSGCASTNDSDLTVRDGRRESSLLD